MIFGGDMVRLGVVAGRVGENEIVPQVGRVAGPWDEVIDFRAFEILMAVEASTGLNVQ